MDISGDWYNELNSKVHFELNGKTITGTYQSAVGDAVGPYELIGQLDESDETPTIGWVVVWQNGRKDTHAVTAWSGQVQDIEGVVHIETMWLLTNSTTDAEEWQATLVGNDVFTRDKRSDNDAHLARLRRGLKE